MGSNQSVLAGELFLMNTKANENSSLFDKYIMDMENASRSLWDIIVLLFSNLVNDLNAISVHQSEFIRDYCDKKQTKTSKYTGDFA